MIKERVGTLIRAAKKRKKLTAAVVVVLVALIVVMASSGGKKTAMAMGGHGGSGGMGGSGGKAQEAGSVATVAAVQPATGSIEKRTSLTGTVEPADVVYVYAKAAGDVTSVLVKAGDTVQAGQLLCTINTEQVETSKNSMDSSAVSLSEAQSTLSRMQLLYQGGDISDQEWEQYQNNVKTAKLSYESAKLNYERQVEYSSITAPIGGKIESCDLEVYDRVSQSDQLCVITGEGNKRVSFYVTEEVVQNMHQGDTMTVLRGDSSYEGTISDISTMVDESNGLFKVKADLPEANAIATGSVVKISVVSDRADNVMTVPVDAIYYDGGVGNVYVYEDGVVHKKEVEVGLYNSELAEIRSGLTTDEMVVSTWSSQLYEGSTVKLKSETEASAADSQTDAKQTDGQAKRPRAAGTKQTETSAAAE